MIYQLIDDGSRFDVGTRCFEQMENAQDAMETLKAAFAEYGVPQQLLSDNGGAFNLSRQGLVNQTEIFLASVGCEAITDASMFVKQLIEADLLLRLEIVAG